MHRYWMLLWVSALPVCCTPAAPDVTVRIDAGTRYQTISGWGKTTPWLPAHPLLRAQVIGRAVNDLGINRLRFEGFCGNGVHGRGWEWDNDNDNPRSINWLAFNTAALDQRATEWIVPWKRAVEARGEPFDLYVSPSFFRGGSSGDLPPWMAADPQEYAEWIVALFLRLRDVHGVVPDYLSICNEAGNGNAFSPQVLLKMARATMPRLQELGFSTRLQFSEAVNAKVGWDYVQALRNERDLWDWTGLISYHWYGQDNQTYMAKLKQFADELGVPTAQTEFMGLTIDHLYDDLTVGGTSYWEIYGLASPDYEAALSHVSSTTFSGGDWYWRFRQVSHYVRPGAVRIGAAVSDPAVRALAFSRSDGPAVTIINTGSPATARRVTLAGLSPGLYGVSQAVDHRPCEELGTREVGQDDALTVDVPAQTVLTVYARSGANLPPTVTAWSSQPEYLTLPASELQLACSATDPDRDALSYAWTVRSQPNGAAVSLGTPDQGTCRATGLSAAGDYEFAVRVSDGANAVTREVLVRVFEGNQAPISIDVHNRIPVRVSARDAATLLRAGAWDIERDPVTFRWTVAAQPPGAATALETPDKPACKVTGMTVPGDYRFALQVSDPTHNVGVTHTVPVYP